jgi:hypothetical protein
MTYMLEQQLMCDVTFLVGPDQIPIKAHKYMLASASPVFYSMFEGPFAEKGEVIIPDIEREVFQDSDHRVLSHIASLGLTPFYLNKNTH